MKGIRFQRKPSAKRQNLEFKSVPMGKVLELIDRLDISPKNEQFNVSTIAKFVRGYKGKELEGGILRTTGKNDIPIDMGNGICYFSPIRRYSIENNGKILKMSGSKRRLGTSSDGQFRLNR